MHRTGSHAKNRIRLLIAGLLATFLLPAAAAHALGTAAGTTIGNSATVTYNDPGSNSYSVTSAATTVTVTEVYDVTLNAPAGQNGGLNSYVYYGYTITNTGNGSNTFALAAASDGGATDWGVAILVDTDQDGAYDAGEDTPTATTGPLAADASYYVLVRVAIPSDATNGQTDVTTLTVTGADDAGAGDDATHSVTTTAQAPVLSVTKNVRNATLAGAFGMTADARPAVETVEYRIAVTNNGSINATSVVLTDAINAATTYTAASIVIGSDDTYAGGGNIAQDDNATGAEACGAAEYVCGIGSVTGATVTANLGAGATESAGGTLRPGDTVYVYFRVTVN